MMLLLLSTLSGWTQSSQKWTISLNPRQDTVLQYNFSKSQIRNLRLYISELETCCETNNVNELLLDSKDQEVILLRKIITNKDSIITTQQNSLNSYRNINSFLNSEILEKEKKSKTWPLWLGGGFVGGVLVCLLLK